MLQFCSENSVKMLCTVEDLKFEASRTLDIWQSNAAVLANNTLEALRVGLEEAHPLSPKHIDVATPEVSAPYWVFIWIMAIPNQAPQITRFMVELNTGKAKSSGAGVSFGYTMAIAAMGCGSDRGGTQQTIQTIPINPERNSKRRPPSSQKKSLKKPQT